MILLVSGIHLADTCSESRVAEEKCACQLYTPLVSHDQSPDRTTWPISTNHGASLLNFANQGPQVRSQLVVLKILITKRSGIFYSKQIKHPDHLPSLNQSWCNLPSGHMTAFSQSGGHRSRRQLVVLKIIITKTSNIFSSKYIKHLIFQCYIQICYNSVIIRNVNMYSHPGLE